MKLERRRQVSVCPLASLFVDEETLSAMQPTMVTDVARPRCLIDDRIKLILRSGGVSIALFADLLMAPSFNNDDDDASSSCEFASLAPTALMKCKNFFGRRIARLSKLAPGTKRVCRISRRASQKKQFLILIHIEVTAAAVSAMLAMLLSHVFVVYVLSRSLNRASLI